MRSRTPKVLHDLCGRPMIAWPVAAALEAGAGKVVVVDGPAAAARGPPARGRRARGPARGRTAPAAPCRPRRAHLGDERRCSSSTATSPLVTAEALAALVDAHAAERRRRRPSPRWSSTTRRATGASCARADGVGRARGRDEGRRRRDRRGARDPRGQRRRLRLRRRARCIDALERLTPDNAQGELYLPVDARAARAASPPIASTTPRCCSASTTASTSRASARSPRRASIAAHMRAGVTIVDPASTLIDVGVAHRRRHGDRAVVVPARRDRRSASAAPSGPLTTLIDATLGDEVAGACTPTSSSARCAPARASGPFAYLRPGTAAARAREGRHVRRDQELRHRRGHEGPAPQLHRRRRRRARARTSAPRRSPPTTTAAASTARRSARTCARRSTRPSSRR